MVWERNKMELPASVVVGHAEIDGDHQELVDLINDISEMLETQQPAELTRLILKFIDTISEHFQREEFTLREIGFPGVDLHALHHREIIRKFPDLIENANQVQDGMGAWESLVQDLTSLLFEDVIEADMDFKSHFELMRGAKAVG